ncbi:hypothetical protein BDZ97DRAFT_1765785 [Flammula alnicola]|nr:hypothetical protein BDZ97DRAFT_1765785 [Flammula alnicola]
MSWSGTMVDDSDPTITYTAAGPAVWFSETAADFVRFGSDNPGDPSSLADAFQSTAHVLRVSGLSPSANGSLSYNFNGSRVAVYSAYSALNALTFSQQEPMPSWECFVDGVGIVPNQAFNSFPWKSYCETDGLSPGSHLINMNILLFSATSEFWVDFIKYGPSQNTSASEPQARFVDSTDIQLQYAGDWTPLGSANVTNPINQTSTVTIPFEGASLAWYALSRSSIVTIDPGSFQNISSGAFIDGTYTIDGDNKSSTHFSAAYASPSINSPYNTMLFDTLTFPSGQHNLTVSFDCQAGLGVECPPITLDYFIVEPGSSVVATRLPTGTLAVIGAVSRPKSGEIHLQWLQIQSTLLLISRTENPGFPRPTIPRPQPLSLQPMQVVVHVWENTPSNLSSMVYKTRCPLEILVPSNLSSTTPHQRRLIQLRVLICN